MVGRDEAVAIATSFIADCIRENPDVVIHVDAIRDHPEFYLVPYNTKEAIENPDQPVGLLGNFPIRVDKATGEPRDITRDELSAIYEASLSPEFVAATDAALRFLQKANYPWKVHLEGVTETDDAFYASWKVHRRLPKCMRTTTAEVRLPVRVDRVTGDIRFATESEYEAL